MPTKKRRSSSAKKATKLPKRKRDENTEANHLHNEIAETSDNLKFDDPFGEKYDSEDERITAETGEINENDDEKVDNTAEVESEETVHTKVWRPGHDELADGETLVYDSEAYIMYHNMKMEWPCLSFDIIKDTLGVSRTKFPMTAYMIAGTQADRSENNKLLLCRMSELHKTQKDGVEDSDNDSIDSDIDDDPVLETRSVPHVGGVNRIRSCPQRSNIVATWSDTSDCHIFDVGSQIQSLTRNTASRVGQSFNFDSTTKPVHTFTGHPDEGYAMDWSNISEGKLLTGDCASYIYQWNPVESGWNVDKVPFTGGHEGSVEDIQWSPTEASVFASCGVDRTVRIWDTRKKNGSMLSVTAHEEDVNVISWNPNVGYLIISGSDDGTFKIWDLRSFKPDAFVAHYKWHNAPITSVEWHPTDESVLAVSGADNQITLWDLALEADDEPSSVEMEASIPPQLLFVHQGQRDIKEIHFHPQLPGVLMSTAADGFNVFKPDVTE